MHVSTELSEVRLHVTTTTYDYKSLNTGPGMHVAEWKYLGSSFGDKHLLVYMQWFSELRVCSYKLDCVSLILVLPFQFNLLLYIIYIDCVMQGLASVGIHW